MYSWGRVGGWEGDRATLVRAEGFWEAGSPGVEWLAELPSHPELV